VNEPSVARELRDHRFLNQLVPNPSSAASFHVDRVSAAAMRVGAGGPAPDDSLLEGFAISIHIRPDKPPRPPENRLVEEVAFTQGFQKNRTSRQGCLPALPNQKNKQKKKNAMKYCLLAINPPIRQGRQKPHFLTGRLPWC